MIPTEIKRFCAMSLKYGFLSYFFGLGVACLETYDIVYLAFPLEKLLLTPSKHLTLLNSLSLEPDLNPNDYDISKLDV